jgi:hypothetical protein
MRDRLLRPVFQQVARGVFPFSVGRIFANGEAGVWYDLSDLSTLFQDRAGTTPVTGAGQEIGRVLDKSGRGNHLTANSDATRGLYQVDQAGLPYILFDGSINGYVTPTITPGIDKVQVFAGVRKLSDASVGMIAESSVDAGSNNGAFRFLVPGNPGYEYRQRGTINAAGAAATPGYASPITNVVTGLGDISGDRTTIRVNGTQVAQSTSDQGTGNFLAYPLYIGRRGGTSLPFNGRIYSLIVRFGPNLDAQRIRQVEHYVAEKTGVSL